mgnify:CR=1 FL=1
MLFRSRKVALNRLGTQGGVVFLCRRSRDHGILLADRFGDPALSTDLGSIGYTDMPGDANLSSDHDPVAHFGAAADTRLCGNDRRLPYFYVMCDLYEVVELGTFPDDRGTDRGPVDRCIGTDLHLVLDDHVADLGDLGASQRERSLVGRFAYCAMTVRRKAAGL